MYLWEFLVDGIAEVIKVAGETPSLGVKLDTEFILDMAKAENGVKILLNIDRVLMTAYMLH